MADQRTMAQLLQAPTKGYEDAIVVPAITADNFELKHGLLTLVQNKQFFGHDKEDPHHREQVQGSLFTQQTHCCQNMVRALLMDKKGQSHAPVKAVEESCVTCGVNFNQGNTGYRPLMMSNQIRPPGFPPVPNNQNLQRNNQSSFIPN
nr:reverse transcriptase domain-containing protein [Tanacetum cinerariifolium]